LSELWAACAPELELVRLRRSFYRVVESQEQVATNSLVKDLREQSVLEQMLEQTKPSLRPGAEKLHYLLATPFRYPPLRHGSRFGARHEPSLLYGALQKRTAFAETAYYRLLFWYGMSTPPGHKLVTQHTVFSAACNTEKGLRLEQPPCQQFESYLRDPASYAATQSLGSAMRGSGVLAFTYRSARDHRAGLNIALFEPQALSSRKPTSQQNWLCETNGDSVSFSFRYSLSGGERYFHYPLEQFLVDGKLPHPAV